MEENREDNQTPRKPRAAHAKKKRTGMVWKVQSERVTIPYR